MASATLGNKQPSLRAEQVAQTRAALVDAGRQLFGAKGFRSTSVEDLAREARVTTGALYHHFPTKTALFEAVFERTHEDLTIAAAEAAHDASDGLDALARGVDAFLDAALRPDVQQILVVDGPAVLGPARYTELDERSAFAIIVAALQEAVAHGALRVDDPQTLTRLLLGALSRGAMLIASSPDQVGTRDAVSRAMRALLDGLRPAKRA
jgi:AcrR family transcriptional regulator